MADTEPEAGAENERLSDPVDTGEETEELEESSLLSHLVELRDRLIRCFITVLVLFVCLFPFSEELFTLVAKPLIDALPAESSMIATQVASPFLIPFKTTLWVALFAGMPMIIYQVWAFVAPGLYKREKKFAIPLVVSSVVLFFCGVAFAYFVVFPLIFAFFNAVAPEGVAVMTDISNYLDFILLIFFAFGLAFEVPIATVMLVWSGLVSTEKLGTARPYVFLGAFVAGMLLTPPDVISQTLLAVPIYLLFEVGIIMSRVIVPKRDTGDTAESSTDAA
jgi:sec-independent protein translocase protein TatC